MIKLVLVLAGFMTFFSACSAEAADFSAVKKGLPSLVMLSTPT